jgi:hypothetical protein
VINLTKPARTSQKSFVNLLNEISSDATISQEQIMFDSFDILTNIDIILGSLSNALEKF